MKNFTDILCETMHDIHKLTGRKDNIEVLVSEEAYFDVYEELRQHAECINHKLPVIPLDTAVLNTPFGTVAVRVRKQHEV